MNKMPTTSSDSLVQRPLKMGGAELISGDFLKKGEIILARIISSDVKGRVILQMGEIKLAANTQGGVEVDSIVNLKVINSGKEPLLQIVSQSDKSQLQLKSGGQPLVKDVIKLLSLSSPLILNKQEKIEAKVVSASDLNGMVKLLVGQKNYEGISANNLKRGETILLELVRGGKNPQLRIISSGESNNRAESKALPIKLLTPLALKGITVGELLVAKVIANNVKGEVTLRLGEEVMKIATERPVTKGQEIYLRVIKDGHSPQVEQISVKTYLQEIRLGAYRSILPRQANLTEALQKLVNTGQVKSADLSSTVKAPIEALIKQLPTIDKVSVAPQLREVLSNTGLFTEAKLLAGLMVRSDLKMDLNHIISVIRPILLERHAKPSKDNPKLAVTSKQAGAGNIPQSFLDDLFRSSDSAVAKIQAQQLASLPSDDSLQQVWHYSLPVHNGDKLDQFNIQIERKEKDKDDNESISWGITLQVDLTPLGPMRVQLKLKDKAVSTTFWAEKQSTLTLVNQNLPTLKGAFERAGLVVTDLRVLHGLITPMEDNIPKDLSLLNVKV
ncbi:MAG: flagellar hook-length control protein FliK [Chromatiales bacterium]|nr:flagellar hook-length control protein FliK [Chromatiales bacterium]